jgi:hypothetical protein
MDKPDHVLVGPFRLSDYNYKVGCESTQIHKQEDDLGNYEVSPIPFLSDCHYLN